MTGIYNKNFARETHERREIKEKGRKHERVEEGALTANYANHANEKKKLCRGSYGWRGSRELHHL
jgi:hypothetical protein